MYVCVYKQTYIHIHTHTHTHTKTHTALTHIQDFAHVYILLILSEMPIRA